MEGSTRRWEEFPDAMLDVVVRHDQVLIDTIEDHGGTMINYTGDGVVASFDHTDQAVVAAADMQRRLAATDFSSVGGLRARIAVHLGDVVDRDGEYFGWALNVAARLNAAGHGGQVVLSGPAAESLTALAAAGLSLQLLGEQRLRDVAQPLAIYQLNGPDLPSTFPPLRSASPVRRLPAPTKSLLGRDDDLARARHLVGQDRLVTVVGPRGVGTSRLAAEVAHRERNAFANGAVRLDFTAVESDAVAAAAATALGVGTRAGQSVEQSLLDWLADQALLIVVEHWERVHESVRDLARAMLDAAPHCTVLATGSRPLDVDGESLLRLGPLDAASAAALFVDRASATGVTVTADASVRSLCDRLDGMPLSIEVAAANTSTYSVAELHDLLDRGDGPGSTTRAMVEAISIAIDALPPGMEPMLLATGVFAGRFDRGGFARVCAPELTPAEAAEALGELVNRSLVHLADSDGRLQFRLLGTVAETIRQRTTPEAAADTTRRFVSFVTEFIGEAADELRGPDELLAQRRLTQQFPNVRAAFDRSLALNDLDSAVTIATTLWDYAFMRFNDEYFSWSERLLADYPDAPQERLAPVRGVAALSAWFRDELDASLRWADEALLAEEQLDLDFDLPARLAKINATVYSGAGAAPPELFAQQADYQRSRPERYFHVNVRTQNSIMATWLGQTDSALHNGLEAVRLARESENPSSLAFALWGLASAVEVDDPVQAETFYANALAAAREVENQWLTALVQMSLASLRRRVGSAVDAAPLLLGLLDLLTRAGHHSHLWATLRLCGIVVGDLGDDVLAVQLRTWVDGVKLAMPATPADASALDAVQARIVDDHGEAWVARQGRLTAMWNTDSAVSAARAALERHLAEAVPAS